VRDPFAVACRARDRLDWPAQKALVLIVAAQEDGAPAWSYAAELCAVLGIPEDAQEAIYRESLQHRESFGLSPLTDDGSTVDHGGTTTPQEAA